MYQPPLLFVASTIWASARTSTLLLELCQSGSSDLELVSCSLNAVDFCIPVLVRHRPWSTAVSGVRID